MKAAVNIYIIVMCLVFFAAGAAFTKRVHDMVQGDPYACFGGERYLAQERGDVCPGFDR